MLISVAFINWGYWGRVTIRFYFTLWFNMYGRINILSLNLFDLGKRSHFVDYILILMSKRTEIWKRCSNRTISWGFRSLYISLEYFRIIFRNSLYLLLLMWSLISILNDISLIRWFLNVTLDFNMLEVLLDLTGWWLIRIRMRFLLTNLIGHGLVRHLLVFL